MICNPGIHLLVESHNPDIYWNRKCLQLKGCLIVEHIFPLLHSQLIGIFQPLTSNLSAKLIDARIFQNLQFVSFSSMTIPATYFILYSLCLFWHFMSLFIRTSGLVFSCHKMTQHDNSLLSSSVKGCRKVWKSGRGK